MGHFTDWIDWYKFREFTATHCNIFLPKKQRKFLETIVEVAGKNKKSFNRGDRLFRARKGCEERKIVGDVLMPAKAFSGKDMNIPPSGKRCAGRVNPKGVPCLYLGTDKNTGFRIIGTDNRTDNRDSDHFLLTRAWKMGSG